MKTATTWRAGAIGAALSLVAVGLVPSAATAADIYYPDIVLGAEDADSDRGYPAGVWFTGSASTGTQTQSDDGLTVTANTRLLYGADEIPLTGDSFVALAQSIDVDADGPWSLQLSVYLDNEEAKGFTTFRPAALNTAPGDLTSQWISSWATPNYPEKNSPLTLEQIADEIDASIAVGDEPALLAFGVLVDDGWDALTLRSFTFDGDTHFFTPEHKPVPEPEPDPKPVPKPVNLVDISNNKNSKNYTQFHSQIQWLANEGITRGWNVGGGKHEFRPKEEITREAMAAFMYRAAGSPAVTLPKQSPFADVTPQNTNFYKEIVWLNQQGISKGWNVPQGKNEFRPKANITRDAMAAFMYRFAETPAFTAPSKSPFVDVTPQTQFYKEISWLADARISTGWTATNEYRPYDEISREAMAAFLYRFHQL